MKVIDGKFGKKEEERPSACEMFELIAEAIDPEAEAVAIVYEEGAPVLLASNCEKLDAVAMLLMMGQQALMMQVYGEDADDDTIH